MTALKTVIQYLRDAVEELRQVSWPSRRQVIEYTLIILASVAVAMTVVATLDYLLSLAVDRFIIR